MAKIFKRGKNWGIDYILNGRRKREMIGPNKALANNVLRKRMIEVLENKHLDIRRNSKIKFDEFADEYIELYAKENNKKSLRKFVLPNLKRLKAYFGDKYLHEITPFEVDKYRRELSKEVQPATVNRGLALLKSMFNRAIAWDKYHDINPVKGIKFAKEQPRLRFLEKEEIPKLLAFSPSYLKPILITALHTGMRKSEILNLKWYNVDIKREVITLFDTKNDESREVPINDEVMQVFLQTRKHLESPYVFCKPNGKPFQDVRGSFVTACQKAGITDFRFHDLRHTFGSQMRMCGVDIMTIAEILGHKSTRMTERYAHANAGHKKSAVDKLSQLVTNRAQDKIDNTQPIVNSEVRTDKVRLSI